MMKSVRPTHASRAQSLLTELAQQRGLSCEPSLFIEQSNVVRIDSGKVRWFVPPALVITSAAINGLDGLELRWLIATEISRLDRGASTLAHRNKAMRVGLVLHFLFIGSFKMLGQYFTLGDRAASTGSIFTSGKVLFSAIFLLVMFISVVGNGLLALIGVGLINALLISVLCRRWPDRRYASKQLKNHGIDKLERKALIKKLKPLLKSKEAFAHAELQGCAGYRQSDADIRLFSIRNNIENYKQQSIGLAIPKRLRHTLATLAGLYVAFYLFSYPLFDIYKLAMPKSVINKYRFEHNILDWNPDYVAHFTYQGNPASVKFSFIDEHTAKVKVTVADQLFRGIARIRIETAPAERYTAERNQFLSARFLSVVFTRFGADSGASSRDEDALEQTITHLLNSKLKGQVSALGKREGMLVRVNYKPLFNFIPLQPRDWLIKMDHQLSPMVQL